MNYKINIFHILLSLFFIYVAITGKKNKNIVFNILSGLFVMGVVYHIYRFVETSNVLNIFHLIVVFPLIGLISYYRQDTQEYMFVMLFFVAFAALWVHVKKIIRKYVIKRKVASFMSIF